MAITQIRKLSKKDSERIKCSAGGLGTGNPECQRKATKVEYWEGLGSISFHYFCNQHAARKTIHDK